VLFSVNLATAELTEVGPTGVTPVNYTYGLGWDPVTKLVYAYNYQTDDFYTVNTTTGAFTLFNDDVFTEMSVYAMHFDSAGNVWAINDDFLSAPLADLDDTQFLLAINPYPDGEEGNIYSESIIIAPAPALAATGADNSASTVVAGVGALLVIGGIVIARRRRATA
jgi:LPXTG-motif cell wall-anchored protein